MKHSIYCCLLVVAALGAPWSAAVHAAAPANDRVDQIRLRSGQLPSVKLSADIIYRYLAAEIAAHRGQYDMASQTMLDLAQDTLDPRLAQRAFQLSMADHNMQNALKSAREWVLLAPDNPDAVATSLALAASNGQTSGLAAALRARVEKADDKQKAIAQAAVIVGKMTDKKLAFDVLDKALKSSAGTSSYAHLALADAAWSARDADRALSESQKALALDPGSESAAQRLLEYGFKVDPDAAIGRAHAYIKKHPDSRQLQLMLVGRLVGIHDYDGALAQLGRMRERTPEDFDLLYTQAQVNLSAGRYGQAQSELKEYINVQMQRRQSINDNATSAMADASDARLLLVQIAEKQNRLPDAIEQLGRIDDPSLRFQARIHQAVLQGRLGDLAQARHTIQALKPTDKHERAVAALTMSSIYREAGRTDVAVQTLVDADKAMPDTSEIKYDLGMLYARQGKYDEFETLMRRVIELDPDNANAYNSLGYTLADQNTRLDEAYDLLEHALELEPDNAFILDSMGWYFYRVGDNDQALEYLQRSYDKTPSADVAAHLGEVLWKLGRRDEATKIWHAGLGKDQGNETLLETLERYGVQP